MVQKAINQRKVMTAVAGAEPSLIKVSVGLFVPGTQYASDAGLAANTNGSGDIAAQQTLTAEMQLGMWNFVPYVPMGCTISRPRISAI